MIQLTRINHVPLVLNSDLIEHIEAAPDTIISLTNGQKLVVRESIDDIVRRVIDFRRAISVRASEANFSPVQCAPPECND